MMKNFFNEQLHEKKKDSDFKVFLHTVPISTDALSLPCSFHRRMQTPPDLLSRKHIFLPRVLVCHGEVHETWNKSHLPVLTSYDNP